MARIRSIHPGLWTDEAFVSVSMAARLLHIGIWNECDDIGCFEWKPLGLRMKLFAADNADVPALLSELVSANMVMHYEINGRSYGAVRNFCRFQKPKAPKSVHPNTPAILLYVGSPGPDGEKTASDEGQSSEAEQPEEPKFPKKAEIDPPEPIPFPKKAEIAPQMEEGGGRMERENRKNPPLPSVALPPAKGDPKGSRLPDDWRPSADDAAYAASLRLDPVRVSQDFRDYWLSKPGKEARKTDWSRTWQTWCRRDAERRPPQQRGQSAPLPESQGARLRRELGLSRPDPEPNLTRGFDLHAMFPDEPAQPLRLQ